MKLEAWLIKNLVQDIEQSGKTRSSFNLLALCDDKVSIYGDKATEKRRAVQLKFSQLLLKNPLSYRKFLDRFKVKPGPGLLREVREHKREVCEHKSSLSNSSSSNSSSSIDSSDTEDEEEEEVEEEEELVPIQSKLTKLQRVVSAAPQEVSVASHPTIMSAAATKNPEDQVLKQVQILESDFTMNGSADYPFLVIVDPEHPEQNWGFEVSRVSGIEHNNYTRDAYHIRKTTHPTQEDDWQMTIPSEKYPKLAGRALLCGGPSQDIWTMDAERYHDEEYQDNEALIKMCDKTKIVHQTLQTAITENPTRKIVWYLLVFPIGTVFENFVLSQNDTRVLKGQLDFCDDFLIGGEEYEVLGAGVFWRIALKGGELIRSPPAGRSKKKRYARSRSKAGSNDDKDKSDEEAKPDEPPAGDPKPDDPKPNGPKPGDKPPGGRNKYRR